MRNEVEWLAWLKRKLPTRSLQFSVGAGDDAAVIRLPPGYEVVVTTDLIAEGVHFLPRIHPPDAIGFKAVMRGASDLAAMAATPIAVFLSVCLRRNTLQHWLEDFLAGVRRACRRVGLTVGGGDTTLGGHSFFVDVTVLGQVKQGKAILRSGAKPGDELYVSGQLGRAALGLEMLRHGASPQNKRLRKELRRHLYPQARCRLALELARLGLPTAMIDLSDGLSTDLGHLCRASDVGALVESAALPRPKLPLVPGARHLDAVQLALHGGEDYELLFTVPNRRRAHVPKRLAGVDLTRIGRITRERGLYLVRADGHREALPLLGWDHFRKQHG